MSNVEPVQLEFYSKWYAAPVSRLAGLLWMIGLISDKRCASIIVGCSGLRHIKK